MPITFETAPALQGEITMSTATATQEKLVTRPLQHYFGAEISGLDLRAPLDDDTFAAVLDAFNTYAVLVFRGQDLTDEQHIAFSQRFGELEKTSFAIASDNPYIYRLANVDDDGNVLELDAEKRAFLEVNGRWHTDSSFKEIPALGSLLSAKEVPSRGGDTQFASMRTAYETCSESRKQSFEGVIARHHHAYSLSLFGGVGATQDEMDALPPVEHPVLRTHEPTGKKSLYVSGHIESIVGMPVEEGRLFSQLIPQDVPRFIRPFMKMQMRKGLLNGYKKYKREMNKGFKDSFIYYSESMGIRAGIVDEWEQFFEKYDLLVCPMSYGPAYKRSKTGAPIHYDGKKFVYLDYAWPYLTCFNASGHPGINIPLGLGKEGLPMGVQVVGPYWSEPDLIQFAKLVSEFTPGFIKPEGY